MMRAGRAEKMMIRCARSTASSTSWVTKIVVFFSFWLMLSNCICRNSRVCASRAPNGSSINKRSGADARVRAIATRWRMPPEIRLV